MEQEQEQGSSVLHYWLALGRACRRALCELCEGVERRLRKEKIKEINE